MRHPFLDLGAVNAPWQAQLDEAARRVVASGRYVGGNENEALEQQMCTLTGASCCVGTSNGLDALTLSLRAAVALGRLHEGDGVLVPANTYIASWLAISHAGLVPMPVDVDPHTMNISAGEVARMAPQAKALMTVHLYGRVAWDADLERLRRRHSLWVIEDAAQAIGAVGVGSIGDAAAFSFYPTKNVGALGDGGAVVTSDAALAATVRTLANYGADRRYHNLMQGFNCRLDPIQAAMLMVKLPHVAEINARRRYNAQLYHALVTNPLVTKPTHPANPAEHVWHQYVVQVPAHLRDRFISHLAAEGIGTDIHYAVPPLHQPCYAADASRWSAMPVTDMLKDRIVSLPISEATSPADIREIALAVNRFTFQ